MTKWEPPCRTAHSTDQRQIESTETGFSIGYPTVCEPSRWEVTSTSARTIPAPEAFHEIELRDRAGRSDVTILRQSSSLGS